MLPAAATLRYDCLRISLKRWSQRCSDMHRMHDEFLNLLDATPACSTIVVELDAADRPTPELVSLLRQWRRIASQLHLKFRLNGISQTVNRVQTLMAARSDGRHEFSEEVGSSYSASPLAMRL